MTFIHIMFHGQRIAQASELHARDEKLQARLAAGVDLCMRSQHQCQYLLQHRQWAAYSPHLAVCTDLHIAPVCSRVHPQKDQHGQGHASSDEVAGSLVQHEMCRPCLRRRAGYAMAASMPASTAASPVGGVKSPAGGV